MSDDPVIPRPCPNCGQAIRYQFADPGSREDSPIDAAVYCEECGWENDPEPGDWELANGLWEVPDARS